jgi:predicted transcriptional regulator
MKKRQDSAVLLSVRPKFARLILSGAKTVELRKSPFSATKGDRIYIYVSSPQSSVVGSFEVKTITSSSPSLLWRMVRDKCGISRSEFNEYYDTAVQAVAIFLCKPRSLEKPIPLKELRRRIAGFHPPQSYRYLPLSLVDRLGLDVE